MKSSHQSRHHRRHHRLYVAGTIAARRNSTRAPTSFPSAPSSTKWPPARCRSAAIVRPLSPTQFFIARPLRPIRLNPDIPAKLEDVINKALEKNRNLRYQHAADLRTDLQRLKRDSDSGRSAAHAAEPSFDAPPASAPEHNLLARTLPRPRAAPPPRLQSSHRTPRFPRPPLPSTAGPPPSSPPPLF